MWYLKKGATQLEIKWYQICNIVRNFLPHILCYGSSHGGGGGGADGAAAGAAGCLLWLIERHPFNYADSATGAHCSNTLWEGCKNNLANSKSIHANYLICSY